MNYLYAKLMGSCPLGCSGDAALENGSAIVCELRFAVTKMKNTHSHRLNLS